MVRIQIQVPDELFAREKIVLTDVHGKAAVDKRQLSPDNHLALSNKVSVAQRSPTAEARRQSL